MHYTQDISRAFDDVAGSDGADKTQFEAALAQARGVLHTLCQSPADTAWPILNACERSDDLALIEQAAQRIGDHFSTLVVVGMGGSSLGSKALVALAPEGKGVKVHFVDNIDPHTCDHLLAALDFKTTMFLIVSKSGGTAETLAVFLILLQAAEQRLGTQAARDHFIAITEPGTGTLRRIAAGCGIAMLEHPTDIGGRFAALTAVGLLPAAVAGVDIRAVRAGAASVVQHTFLHAACEPARGAALHLALMERGKTLAVLMPYCDRLDIFNSWYRQIWAESLGKNGKGTTPLRSLGACDQHSQLQLYLDGPRDKFITMILLAQAGSGPALSSGGEASLGYLEGHTLGDLMEAEQRATLESLARGHCPLRVLALPALGAAGIGALMMHFMIETIITARLLGVNAFDQPAVEEGKRLARDYLNAQRRFVS